MPSSTRLAVVFDYADDFTSTAAEITEFERIGVNLVSAAEAYSVDAVSQLGSRVGHPADLLAHADAPRDDGGGARFGLPRPIRTRNRISRCAARPHPGERGDPPRDLAT